MLRILMVALAALGLDVACYCVYPALPKADTVQMLQGRWEVVSMMRGGAPDSAQIGAWLIFDGDMVIAQPKGLQISDGTG